MREKPSFLPAAFTVQTAWIWAGVTGLAAFLFIGVLFFLRYLYFTRVISSWTGLISSSLCLIAGGYCFWAMQRFHHLARVVRQALAQSGQSNTWKAAIDWSFGSLENEMAFRTLQKEHRAMAERIRFYGRSAGQVWGMLALLPGVKWFLEKYLVISFLRHPRPLRLHPHIQSYVWGQSPTQSYILKFLNAPRSYRSSKLKIAELWVGAHKKNPAVVQAGSFFMDLDRFVPMAGKSLLGKDRKSLRPLFKILDAKQPLSWQMHERLGPEAKSETWMFILTPDFSKLSDTKDKTLAKIHIGFRPSQDIPAGAFQSSRYSLSQIKKYLAQPKSRQEFYQEIFRSQAQEHQAKVIQALCNQFEIRRRKGKLELYLNEQKQPATVLKQYGLDQGLLVLNIPGATLHGLSIGILHELQEMSDKTLRVYDYGRQDPHRPLHIEEAVEKLDLTPHPPEDFLLEPVALDENSYNLICLPGYALDWLRLDQKSEGSLHYSVPMHDCYQILVIRQGPGHLRYAGQQRHAEESLAIASGQVIMIPAALPSYTLTTTTGLEAFKIYEPSADLIRQLQKKRGKKFWERL